MTLASGWGSFFSIWSVTSNVLCCCCCRRHRRCWWWLCRRFFSDFFSWSSSSFGLDALFSASFTKAPLTTVIAWPCSVSDARLLHSFHLLTHYSTCWKPHSSLVLLICRSVFPYSGYLMLLIFFNKSSECTLTPHRWGGWHFKASTCPYVSFAKLTTTARIFVKSDSESIHWHVLVEFYSYM